MTALTDTVRIEAPKRSPVLPVTPLDPSWDNDSESRPSEGWFEVGTPSGSPTQWDRLAMGRGQPLWREAA
jgi:hypothetical protein